jgi:hypothetical protein
VNAYSQPVFGLRSDFDPQFPSNPIFTVLEIVADFNLKINLFLSITAILFNSYFKEKGLSRILVVFFGRKGPRIRGFKGSSVCLLGVPYMPYVISLYKLVLFENPPVPLFKGGTHKGFVWVQHNPCEKKGCRGTSFPPFEKRGARGDFGMDHIPSKRNIFMTTTINL